MNDTGNATNVFYENIVTLIFQEVPGDVFTNIHNWIYIYNKITLISYIFKALWENSRNQEHTQ